MCRPDGSGDQPSARVVDSAVALRGRIWHVHKYVHDTDLVNKQAVRLNNHSDQGGDLGFGGLTSALEQMLR